MVEYKLRFVIAEDIWYDVNIKPSKHTDLVFYNQVQEKLSSLAEAFYTLKIDLCQSVEYIYSNFSKNNKYEITRAIQKDNLTANTFEGECVYDIIQDFCDAYNIFAEERKKGRIHPSHFGHYMRSNSLVITNITHNDTVLVWHTYIVQGKRTRLKTSNSLFDNKDQDFRNLVGRANKLLHWLDMQFFKDKGFDCYDFGGWYSGQDDKKMLGINKFKEGFGGVKEQSWNWTEARTWKGKLYLWLNKLKNR